MKKTIGAAFPYTITVMIGYGFMGFAFGMLFEKAGYGVGYALLSSLLIYSGTLQFLLVSFLSGGASMISIVALSALTNVRYSFYGLSFLQKFKGYGIIKPYMGFLLTDETYAILDTVRAPAGISEKWFCFWIAFFHQLYWVVGSIIGSLLSSAITLNMKGIEFSMSALFVVMFIEQMKVSKHPLLGILGLVISIATLIFAKGMYFVSISIALIILMLCLVRKVGVIHE